MSTLFLVLLFILGACFGSFLCCQARRLHVKSTKKGTKLSSRSICLHCHCQLKWYDNIPIISWLLLHGKCRECGKKIGLAEILSELGLALSFLAIGFTIDINTTDLILWAIFIFILIFTTVLGFLAIYDGLYGELPLTHLLIAIALSVIILILKEVFILQSSSFTLECIYAPLSSVAILGGLYFVLYKISHGKWVGDGDWLLGTAIGFALFHPWFALITLFLANFLALIVMFPSVKKSKNHHIHFGPFLIIAFVITISLADAIIKLL